MKNSELKEKRNRVDFVVGIGLAATLSLVLSVAGNIIYNLFVSSDLLYTKIVGYWIIGIFFIVIIIESFLEFLIVDYKNEMNFDKSFWWRYLNYYDRVYWFNKVVTNAGLFSWFLLKWFIAIIFSLSILASFDWEGLVIWLVFIVSWQLVKYVFRKRKNVNVYSL